MDIEERLRTLEMRYRAAGAAAAAAKAHYLALISEPSASPSALERAQAQWRRLDAHKRGIAARMGEVEALEDATN